MILIWDIPLQSASRERSRDGAKGVNRPLKNFADGPLKSEFVETGMKMKRIF